MGASQGCRRHELQFVGRLWSRTNPADCASRQTDDQCRRGRQRRLAEPVQPTTAGWYCADLPDAPADAIVKITARLDFAPLLEEWIEFWIIHQRVLRCRNEKPSLFRARAFSFRREYVGPLARRIGGMMLVRSTAYAGARGRTQY